MVKKFSESVFRHEPVLVEKILSLFPSSFQNGWVLDCTFGAGGHTKAILNHYPSCSVIALDRDLSSIKWGLENIKSHFSEQSLRLIHANFHQYSNLMERHFPLFMKTKRV